MNLGLADKVAFVAGASRGIGKGIASVLLDEGARVVITGRNQTSLASTGRELAEGRKERLLAIEGDLSQPSLIENAHATVTEKWGQVDALVCNIGSGAAKTGWQITAADWEPAFQINLWATVRLVEVFLPKMIDARRGNIIMISSIAALESFGAPIPYGTAKAALGHYSKDLAKSVGRYGVRVNTVAPGNVLFKEGSWQKKLDANPGAVNAMLANDVPLGRFGTPEEIGSLVAFLVSDRAAFITGACFVADGGQTRS